MSSTAITPEKDRAETIRWLLEEGEPWVRYRVLTDLLGENEASPEVRGAREKMLASPKVRALVAECSEWPGAAITHHNDAKLLIHKLSVLADFGLTAEDPGIGSIINKVMQFQSPEGQFESLVLMPKPFGGSGEEMMSWILCDAPILLYALLEFGIDDHTAADKAIGHLIGLIRENGWPCAASQEFPKFKGPGKREDPCPYATLISLKALLQAENRLDPGALEQGAETLLQHWERQQAGKLFMFGIGSTFRRPKYPFVWYDILHVLDTLSQQEQLQGDSRFQDMLEALLANADPHGRFKAGSVWMAWKDWSFGQKREPSPWITFLVLRILKRISA